MSVFTHSGPFSACGERQKPAKRRRPASELLLARIRKTQVTDSPEMSTMPHRTSTLNDPHIELVRDYGDDIVGSMLMVPTVPILQQMLSELDERSWFGQAHLMSPGHLRGGDNWKMEPLIEVGVAQDNKGEVEGYLFKVAGGVSYSTHHSRDHSNLKVTEIIFSADRDLRAYGG